MHYLSIFLAIVICACSGNSVKNSSDNEGADTVKNEYATGFRIIRHKTSTTIEVINPWQQAKEVKIKYKLTSTGDVTDLNTIKVPIKRVVCMSTTHIAFIDALQEINTITAISGIKLVSNPTIIKKAANKQVCDVGYEQSLNYELLLSQKPDVIFVYGVSADVSSYVNKLKELKIPVIFVAEYLETNALAKAEWLKFFAEFFDKQDYAQRMFDTISNEYNYLKQLALKATSKPKVISGMPFNGTWYISGAKSYAAGLVNDAGGNFAWNSVDSKESVPIDIESVFEMAKGADVWLNIGYVNSKKDVAATDKRLTNLQPYKTGKLFNFNARAIANGGNDYWESGTVKANIVLKDLIAILHPELLPNYKMYYYKKLE
jgi:iron complex transport system substrate-binding protein